jgi:hypothetical protein
MKMNMGIHSNLRKRKSIVFALDCQRKLIKYFGQPATIIQNRSPTLQRPSLSTSSGNEGDIA